MAPCRSHNRNHTRQERIFEQIRQELSPVTCNREETRRRMAGERRGAGSSLVSKETPYYKTIY